jgi:hypothetical protein
MPRDSDWAGGPKQQFPKPPVPPEVVLPWIDQQALKRAGADMPALRPTRIAHDLEAQVGDGEDPPPVELRLDDYPDVISAYERFRPNWETWSEEYQRRTLAAWARAR